MGRPELVLWSMKYQKDNLFLYSLVIKQHGSWSACPVFRFVDDISAIDKENNIASAGIQSLNWIMPYRRIMSWFNGNKNASGSVINC